MGLDANISGLSGTKADVNAANQLKVVTETDAYGGAANVGATRMFSENDGGFITGTPNLLAPETDNDYRLRVSLDMLLDDEVFNTVIQNTGKHNILATTMAGAFTAGQWTSNSASITTANTGITLSTYSTFPNNGTQTLSGDIEIGFSNTPIVNTTIEWGLFIPAATAILAPLDGVFFRLNSSGLQGIASNAGIEETTGLFKEEAGAGVWVYDINKKYQFICYVGGVAAEFWVNDGTGAVKLGTISLPAAQGRICSSQGLKFAVNHRITGGAAGGALQAQLGAYNVRLGGSNVSCSAHHQGNRIYGSYQGLSGGAMGSLANYTNNSTPTALVPTNTTAAAGSVGLGGQFWETDTVAAGTDCIICSYQVPVPAVGAPARRMVITGIKINSFVALALTGGGYVDQWSLAFGHTAVSLATGEAAGTKAPRRVPIGLRAVASGAVINTVLGTIDIDFDNAPVFVNPGEFVQIVRKKFGTAPTVGSIGHLITVFYGWE